MLESTPPAAAPPPPRPAPAPGTPPPQPAAKAPVAGETPAAPPAEEVDDGADLAADGDFLSDAELQGEGEDEGDQDTAVARQASDDAPPARPADYKIEGVEFTDRDQPILGAFTEVAHELQLSNATASSLAQFVYATAQEQRQQRLAADKQDRAVLLRETAEAWGADARANQQAVKSVLGSLPGELREAIKGARAGGDPHGPLLINQPEFLELMAELGRYRGGDVRQGSEADLVEEIKRVRANDFDRYVREGLSQKLAALEEKRAARSSPRSEGPRPGDAAREKIILRTMKQNIQVYRDRRMDLELAAIRERRAGR